LSDLKQNKNSYVDQNALESVMRNYNYQFFSCNIDVTYTCINRAPLCPRSKINKKWWFWWLKVCTLFLCTLLTLL